MTLTPLRPGGTALRDPGGTPPGDPAGTPPADPAGTPLGDPGRTPLGDPGGAPHPYPAGMPQLHPASAPPGTTHGAPDEDAAGTGAAPDLILALTLFAIDPHGTGLALHALAGPARDLALSRLRAMLPEHTPWRRLPAGIQPDALLGGTDLGASLREGRRILQPGLLDQTRNGILLLPMAERLPPLTAAIAAAALDSPNGTGLVALDESEPDESLPAALADRLAFPMDLAPLGLRSLPQSAFPDLARIEAARARRGAIGVPDALIASLCEAAMALGIASPRAPILALAAARAAAAFSGEDTVGPAHAAIAARLVLAPRATRLPETAPPAEPPPPPADPADSPADSPESLPQPGADMLIEAARAAIPKNLLLRLAEAQSSRTRTSTAGRAGASKRGAGRGRPAGIRAAPPAPGLRLALAETLRAAAPWQRLRPPVPNARPLALKLRRDDFRVIRTEHPTRSTTIFVVDASGSSALNRLAEAKGAAELLLADCYARRDQVAVIAFRGQTATLLLPPTRSLTRAKRSLASLPGGGATPLAAGLAAAETLAAAAQRAGQTPTLVVLTDGRANMPLTGPANRAQAEADSLAAARILRPRRGIVIDISPRPTPQARALAAAMGARYLPLPFASAATVSAAVKGVTA